MTVNHDVVGSSPTGGVRKKNTNGVLFSFSYVTISPPHSDRCETKKPPAMRVRIEGYTKKLQTRYNKGVQGNCKAKGENMAQKAHSLSHTKWHCKYHIMFPLSIDEKSSIINIEVV